MTDEQIDAAIAEACGWTEIGKCENGGFRLRGFPPNRYEAHRKPIPNYCADLNAMHEAERVLRNGEWDTYVDLLADTWIEVAHATARQRAEAFLRTLGKWEKATK
jgi:hypothetical protein